MKTKATYLIVTQVLLFVVFLFTTFFFNRFAVDDFHFIGELNTKSFSEIYQHLYFKWHGRWASNFLLVSFLKFHQLPHFLMLYNIVSIGILFLGIKCFFKSINTSYNLNFNKSVLALYSAVFITVLFFCTISPNDSWLWYTSSIVYLWSTTAFFFASSIIIKKVRTKIDWIILFFSACYIGGSNEPLAIISILGLVYLISKEKINKWNVTAIIVLSASFLINYLSSGTIHRNEITPSLGLIDLVLYTGYSSVKYLLFSIGKTFIPALFLSIPFYLLGQQATSFKKNFNPIRELLMSNLFIILVVLINQLLVVYALGGLSPDRSSITSSIIIAIVIVRYFFFLGSYYHQHKFPVKHVLIINVVGLIVFNYYYAKTHYRYAKAVDERIQYIKENDYGLIKVKPLPFSGYIYSSEITPDASNFKNQHLKKGLGTKNNIVLITDW